MISGIRRFFTSEIAPAQDAQNHEQRLRLATCALLLEAAQADDEFTSAERQTVIDAVRTRFELNHEAALQLLDLADQERRASTDLYQFTRLIKEHFSRRDKLHIVESLWSVVWSDGVLEAHEDALMHKIGTLLDIGTRELMALKVRAKRNGPTTV